MPVRPTPFRRDRFRRSSRLTPYSGVSVSPMPDPVSVDVALRPLLVDAKQAAWLLGIGRTTLYELIHAGAMSPLHIGRCVRFAVTDLEAFVANGCVAVPNPRPMPKPARPASQPRPTRRARSGGPARQLFDPAD